MINKLWPVANPCSKCGKQPEQSEIFGMYYCQCRNCDKIELSVSRKMVTENWNKLYGRQNTGYKTASASTANGGRCEEKVVQGGRTVRISRCGGRKRKIVCGGDNSEGLQKGCGTTTFDRTDSTES